jgi:predicted ATPase/DNA-binding SARP family transcriptional activator
VRVALLGPFEVRNDDGDSLPVAGARLRDLIARLALAGGRPVSTSALAEAVWGDDPPADLPNALQTLVSRARRAIGDAAAVEQSAAGYRLAVLPDDVDALRFERLVAVGDVEEALRLWRGPALEDVGEFAAPYALRLTDLRLDATVGWLGGELEAGRAAAHVAELEALTAANPLNEKVTELLMRALAAAGRQAEALSAYERLRARLAEELGIDPGARLRAVHLEVLRGKLDVPTADGNGRRSSRRTNVRAQLTSFVGREEEVNRVGRALTDYRLVTLVGPGGAGKTRLASEVAAQVAGGSGHATAGGGAAHTGAGAGAAHTGAGAGAAHTGAGGGAAHTAAGGGAAQIAAGGGDGRTAAAGGLAPDGVWMAELASVTDAADVPQAVLGSVGLREAHVMLDGTHRISTRDAQTRLIDGLADARALLVLDNCEHLIDACAQLADTLLAHSPGLRIVATSREPLGIVGESLLVVPPLAQDPAVRLFADRAAAVSPGFALDEETLPLVADIVRRLDGLPLAIELAAARLRTLPLAEISRRLDDRFRLLTGGSRTALPRHRTLRAVVEWSWDLLTPAERLLAERFSVFPAGATPEAVAAVCGGPPDAGQPGTNLPDTGELLSSLVDKSLLQPVDGGTRLRMLETIREYGAEKLADRAEIGEVRRRHAGYYSDFMAEATPWLVTRDQLSWLRAVEADRDNILAALHYWCDTQDAARALALAVSSCGPAFMLGNHADIAELIGQVIAVPGEADPDLRTIADAMFAITPAGRASGAVPGGSPGLAERVDALDFSRHPLAALLRPAYAMFTQDNERARRYVEEALASPDEWVVAATWMISAAIAENTGDMDTLRSDSAEALRRFRALGERWGLATALRLVAGVRVLDGDLDAAAAEFAESDRILREMGSRDDESHRPLQLASIAARRGDPAAAREFFESALAVAESGEPGMDLPMVSAGYAMFEVTVGDVERARSLYAAAEQGLALVSGAHPARHHLTALVDTAGMLIALADTDLPLARERGATMYREAIASEDMGLLASVATALAHLAHALGQPERAARMFGACAAVRGAEDPTDPMVTLLEPRLRAALGSGGYDRAYAAGMALSRAEALTLLDPAAL